MKKKSILPIILSLILVCSSIKADYKPIAVIGAASSSLNIALMTFMSCLLISSSSWDDKAKLETAIMSADSIALGYLIYVSILLFKKKGYNQSYDIHGYLGMSTGILFGAIWYFMKSFDLMDGDFCKKEIILHLYQVLMAGLLFV